MEKKRRTRSEKPMAGFRSDPALMDRLDAFAKGAGLNRSAAICLLLQRGLDA